MDQLDILASHVAQLERRLLYHRKEDIPNCLAFFPVDSFVSDEVLKNQQNIHFYVWRFVVSVMYEGAQEFRLTKITGD